MVRRTRVLRDRTRGETSDDVGETRKRLRSDASGGQKRARADDTFNAIALELFSLQFEHNAPFRRFAQARGRTPHSVRHWHDIPPVPIDAFKSLELSCCPSASAERVFMTSGTTQGIKGKSFHADLDVYDASMRANFGVRFMGDVERMRMGILFPTEDAMPNSSLAHYLALAVREFGTEESRHKEIGLAHEADKAPGYETLSAMIKRGTRLAIWLSERI